MKSYISPHTGQTLAEFCLVLSFGSWERVSSLPRWLFFAVKSYISPHTGQTLAEFCLVLSFGSWERVSSLPRWLFFAVKSYISPHTGQTLAEFCLVLSFGSWERVSSLPPHFTFIFILNHLYTKTLSTRSNPTKRKFYPLIPYTKRYLRLMGLLIYQGVVF